MRNWRSDIVFGADSLWCRFSRRRRITQLLEPLRSVSQCDMRLSSGLLDPAGVAANVAALSTGVRIMAGVAQDLLHVKSFRRGVLRVAEAPARLGAVVAAAVAAASCGRDPRVAVSVDLATAVPERVVVDALRVQQVCAISVYCSTRGCAFARTCVRQHLTRAGFEKRPVN